MSSSKPVDPSDTAPVSGYFAPGKSSARELARTVPSARQAKPATARARISAAKRGKKVRPDILGPTPERLAKGDVLKTGGMHRSLPPVERLRDQGKLDHDARTNQMLFEAAEKLKRHWVAAQLIGVKAQDLNRVLGAPTENAEDAREHHRKMFAQARALMGWYEQAPHHGNGRIVVAVVCDELGVFEAAQQHIGTGRVEAVLAKGMDRLRQGLFTLALHWRLI